MAICVSWFVPLTEHLQNGQKKQSNKKSINITCSLNLSLFVLGGWGVSFSLHTGEERYVSVSSSPEMTTRVRQDHGVS